MRFNNKGQMMVLDVLFGVVLIICAFLLLFKFVEIEVYQSNSQRAIDKLNRVGDLAFTLLFNNSENACSVVDSNNSFYLSGTLNKTKTITKQMLSIPDGYSCNLNLSGVSTGCTASVPGDVKDIYIIDFNIASCTSNLSKQQYLACVSSGCSNISNLTGTLKIWRSI